MIRPFQGKSPRIHETAFVAETADVIGDVEVGEHASIWFHSVLRADVNASWIGHHTKLHGGAVACEDW